MNSVCVIIPIYKNVLSELEEISFKQISKVFQSRSLIIIGPPSNKKFMEQLSINHKNIKIAVFKESDFRNISSYNRLLMSEIFYNSFTHFEFILICQLDVFVIKDDLDYWLKQNLDNIGAPLFEGYSKPSLKFKSTGNNGGFCLRKTNSCLEVISKIKFKYSNISTLWNMESVWYWKFFRILRDGIIFNYKINMLKPILNEDIFWSVIVPNKFTFYKAANPHLASHFAFDANPKFLFDKINNNYPMAIHAWWRYDKKFVLEIINKLNINI